MARFSDEKRQLTAALIDEQMRITAALSELFWTMHNAGHGDKARWALTAERMDWNQGKRGVLL